MRILLINDDDVSSRGLFAAKRLCAVGRLGFDLGLVGERPALVIFGINYGSNLGGDTYSGTVAAAKGRAQGSGLAAINHDNAADFLHSL